MRLDVERLAPAPGAEASPATPAPRNASRRLPAWRRLVLRLALSGFPRRR
jgi:hypothetical protein